MSRTPTLPFLISKIAEGEFQVTIRSTRFNSQNYPVVTSTLQPEVFKSATAARTHAKAHWGAEAGQFTSK